MMVALDPPTVLYVPLAEATSRLKIVPLDCDTMLTARDMGINFGDAMPLAPTIPRRAGTAPEARAVQRRTAMGSGRSPRETGRVGGAP